MPRILFAPLYTNTSIGHCTTYIYAKNLLKRIVDSDPNAFVYLPVPKGNRFPFLEVRHPRIKLLTMDLETNQLLGMTRTPAELVELFNDRTGKYFMDAVFTTAHTTAAQLRSQLSTQRDGWSIDPLWVSFVMFGLGDSTPMPEAFKLQQSVGLLASDMTVWQSRASFNRVMETSRRLLSPWGCRHIVDRAVLDFPLTSIPVSRLEAAPKGPRSTDKFAVNYGYALHDTYKYKEIFDVYDELFCSGMPLRVIVTSSSGGFVVTSAQTQALFDKRYDKYFELTFRLTQDQFWLKASEAQAFLFLGQQIESSFSVLEQFMLGLVGVFHDIPYVREVTYPGYPYICRTRVEAATALRYVLEHYYDEDVQTVLKTQQAFIRERFDIGKNTDGLYGVISQKIADLRAAPKPSVEIVRLLQTVFEGRTDPVPWSEFAQTVFDSTMNHINVDKPPDGSRGRSYWRWAMERSGWVDSCQDADPIFVRASSERLK